MPTDCTSSEPWIYREYDRVKWRFPDFTAWGLGYGAGTDLPSIRGEEDAPLWQPRSDQKSKWHTRFYSFFPSWANQYQDFVHSVIAPFMGEPFYYQRIPTFRVHLPGNVAVGSMHTDAEYHHPAGEETFWVPMTPAYDSSTVWVADDCGELQPANATVGQIVQFSAVSRIHGNKVNETGQCRVSFDFRCLPTRLLPDVEGPPSENTKMRFVPGDYYTAEIVHSGTEK